MQIVRKSRNTGWGSLFTTRTIWHGIQKRAEAKGKRWKLAKSFCNSPRNCQGTFQWLNDHFWIQVWGHVSAAWMIAAPSCHGSSWEMATKPFAKMSSMPETTQVLAYSLTKVVIFPLGIWLLPFTFLRKLCKNGNMCLISTVVQCAKPSSKL